MRILDRLLPAVPETEKRYSFSDWMQEAFIYGGQTYPPSGLITTYNNEPAEPIAENFAGHVNQVYKRNGVIFGCELVRYSVFSEARIIFQRMTQGRAGDYFGNRDLTLFELPWSGGSTPELLKRMLLDADFAGNAYVARIGKELVRLRPDWVEILLRPRETVLGQVGWEKVGYAYYEGGKQFAQEPSIFLVDEVAHFAPNPDPDANYRGMSWLTPVIREIQSDSEATKHKLKFFENAATPNLAIKLPESIGPDKYKAFVSRMQEQYTGADNAYKTLYTAGGADVTVIGTDLKQIDFKVTQGAGETRIAMAAGIHPVVLGASEGMQGSSLNAGNFNAARRLTVEKTFKPLWRDLVSCLSVLVPVPAGARLWYDSRDVGFLREDEQDAANIADTRSRTIKTYVDAGFTPESSVSAVVNDDPTLLVHTGLFSVQLQPPGSQEPQPADVPAGTE